MKLSKKIVNYTANAFKIPMVIKANKIYSVLFSYFLILMCFGTFMSTLFNEILLFGGSLVFSMLLCIIMYKWGFPNSSGNTIFRAMKGSDLKRKITINEEGFTNINSSSSTTYNWKSVIVVHDTKNNIIIFIGNALGVLFLKEYSNQNLKQKSSTPKY